MKERPILFSGPMVRALLAGTKTQTRRIVKLPADTNEVIVDPGGTDVFGPGPYVKARRPDDGGPTMHPRIYCPYGYPGDRLWVREAIWCANDSDGEMGEVIDCGSMLSLGEVYAQHQYAATPECCELPLCEGGQTIDPDHAKHEHQHGRWWLAPPDAWDGTSDYTDSGVWQFCPTGLWTKHPSIHMPRWASRITLEVTEVRVERLHAITEEDARAEGVVVGEMQDAIVNGEPGRVAFFNARDAFAHLWAAINGPESWKSNPWVWAVSFRRLEGANAS